MTVSDRRERWARISRGGKHERFLAAEKPAGFVRVPLEVRASAASRVVHKQRHRSIRMRDARVIVRRMQESGGQIEKERQSEREEPWLDHRRLEPYKGKRAAAPPSFIN